MKMKFRGPPQRLAELVADCMIPGEWRYIAKNRQYQFKADTGENLNYWPSTGTVTFQGGDEPILEKRFASLVAPLPALRIG